MQIILLIISVPIAFILHESLGYGYIHSLFFSVVIALVIVGVGTLLLAEREKRVVGEAEGRAEAARKETIRVHFAAHPDHVRILKQIYDRSVYKDDFGDTQFDVWFTKRDDYI